ncbi:MAG: SPOR domain-containing protein [Bacteroidales bacterium]
MKKHTFSLVMLALLMLVLPAAPVQAQSVNAFEGLSIRLNPGVVTFYGEMSNSSLNPFDKFKYGSSFGFNGSIVKNFSPAFGVQAQVVTTTMYNLHQVEGESFKSYIVASVNDYNLSARFDPLLLGKGYARRISPFVSAGVSSIAFRSVRKNFDNNSVLGHMGYQTDGLTKARRELAMAIPISIGVSFRLSDNFSIEAEHSLRLTNTDLLDCVLVDPSANDNYAITSVGLKYTIAPARPASERAPRKPRVKQGATAAKPATEPTTRPSSPNVFIDVEIPAVINANEPIAVNVRINKSAFEGSARLVQSYPAGFIAYEPASGTSGQFSFVNQTVQIEWDRMPADPIVHCDYYIKADGNLSGSQQITGRFEYRDSEGPKTIRFNKQVLIRESEAGQKETARIIPATFSSGVEFRVQCGAFREQIPTVEKIASLYRITDTVQEERHEGWYKYTVGTLKTYEEAVRYRDDFIKRTGLTTAFIVAYRDGVRLARITDALK